VQAREYGCNEVQEALLGGLLAWLTSSVSWFEPPQEEQPVDTAPEEIQPGPRRKAFGELGLALSLAQRSPLLRQDARVRELKEHWVLTISECNVFFDVDRRVCLFPLRLVAYATLRSLGHDIPGVAAALQRVLDRQFMDRRERSAWEKLDLKYYMDAVGLRHAFPPAARLLDESTLPALPSLAHATKFDLYALTHLIFDLSDFGGSPSGVEAVPGLTDYTAVALAMCVAMEDWDLVAEIMAARVCARLAGEGIDIAGARALADAQHESGFVPGRRWTAGELDRAPAADVFFDVYHPTLVSLILIACATAYA
jgi:hypothetical protein